MSARVLKLLRAGGVVLAFGLVLLTPLALLGLALLALAAAAMDVATNPVWRGDLPTPEEAADESPEDAPDEPLPPVMCRARRLVFMEELALIEREGAEGAFTGVAEITVWLPENRPKGLFVLELAGDSRAVLEAWDHIRLLIGRTPEEDL